MKMAKNKEIVLVRRDAQPRLKIQEINLINRTFCEFLSRLGIDIHEQEFKSKFLASPTVETVRDYYAGTGTEAERWARCLAFIRVADQFFRRVQSRVEVSPFDVKWELSTPCRPVEKKWIPYVGVRVESVVIDKEQVPMTRTVKKMDPRTRKEIITQEGYMGEHIVTEDRQEYFFTGAFDKAFRAYKLSPQEAKKFEELEAICDQLNKFFHGSPRAAVMPDYFTYDAQNRQIKPNVLVTKDTFSF